MKLIRRKEIAATCILLFVVLLAIFVYLIAGRGIDFLQEAFVWVFPIAGVILLILTFYSFYIDD